MSLSAGVSPKYGAAARHFQRNSGMGGNLFIALEDTLESLGYLRVSAPINACDAAVWGLSDDDEAQLLAVHPADTGFRVVALLTDTTLLAEEARAWTKRLWSRERTFRGLVIVFNDSLGRAVIACPSPGTSPSSPRIVLVPWSEEPSEFASERLHLLQTEPSWDADSWSKELAERLDIERLGAHFFRSFCRAFTRLSSTVDLPGASPEQIHSLCLTFMTRLIFLHFIQRKGWLDGASDYLRRARRRVLNAEQHLHNDLLKPLFFQALNTPRASRASGLSELGTLPYLNGGLFEPTPIEASFPDFVLSNVAVEEVFSCTFDRFVFVTQEDGEACGIDPEILGRVFENLMHSSKRTATGTYYTPRDLALSLVNKGIEYQLKSKGLEALIPILHGSLHPGTACWGLRDRLQLWLAQVRILDPACGSGVFLLSAMQALQRLYEWLTPERSAESIRRQIVTKNIYGIDASRSAVHLCELRLWLAIVDAADPDGPCEPLPNLDHHVHCGNALLGPIDWAISPGARHRMRAELAELEAVRSEYALTSGPEKHYLRSVIELAETEIATQLLEEHRTMLLERAASKQGALFDAPNTGHQTSETAEIANIDQLLIRIAEEGEVPGFVPDLHFPEVMDAGGFDLVVGNPPWVRYRTIHPAERVRLRARYPMLAKPGWRPPTRRKHSRFADQGDLSAYFVVRAIELLNPHGTLSLLLPSKLFTSLHGGALREWLLQETTPHLALELGETTFPGVCAYPAACIASRRGQGGTKQAVQVGYSFAMPKRISLSELSMVHGDQKSPWNLRGGENLRAGISVVGECEHLVPRRGVMTGLNDAFLRPVEEARDLNPWEVWALRGAEVRPFRALSQTAIRWTHDSDSLRPLRVLPEPLLATLRPFKDKLIARADLRGRGPWWRIFRLGEHLGMPKVVWKDMGQRLSAAVVEPRDDAGRMIVPLNTVYYMAVPNIETAHLVCAWMNSDVCSDFLNAFAERASGGYRRYFAWTLELLPLPNAIVDVLEGGEWSDLARRLAGLSTLGHKLGGLGEDAQDYLNMLVRELNHETQQKHDVQRRLLSPRL